MEVVSLRLKYSYIIDMNLFRKIFILLFSTILVFQGISKAGPREDLPFVMPSKEAVAKITSAEIFTNKGVLLLELYPEIAPSHVANFKYLADNKVFKQIKFSDFEQDYILQIDKPNIPTYFLPPEFALIRHERGVLGMARRSDDINPEAFSSGTQFHLMLGKAKHMDGKYTIFGKIIAGFGTLDKLNKGDSIEDIVVYIR